MREQNMQLFVKLIGVFYLIEGVANLVYWNTDPHSGLFQWGRVLRAGLGIVLVVFG
jgi:uncharacterized membrane protein HdeD (DUF308 family)